MLERNIEEFRGLVFRRRDLPMFQGETTHCVKEMQVAPHHVKGPAPLNELEKEESRNLHVPMWALVANRVKASAE